MGLKQKHRREIRDLMDVLLGKKAWTTRHTDSLMNVVREARSDVAEEVERMAASEYAAQKRELLKLKNNQLRALREVESFREALKDQHAKIAAVLETLIDLPIANAMVRQDDGSYVIDHSLIDPKQATVALAAAEKLLKVTGAYAPKKHQIEQPIGSAFEVLDQLEAEADD